jgi:hypothetical protein
MGGTEKTVDIGYLLGLVSDALGGTACSHLTLSCRVGGSAIELTVKPVEGEGKGKPDVRWVGPEDSRMVIADDKGPATKEMKSDLQHYIDGTGPYAPKTWPARSSLRPERFEWPPETDPAPAAPAETVVDLAALTGAVVSASPLPASGAVPADAPLPASVRTPPAPEAGEPLAPPEPVRSPVADNPGGASAPADGARPLPIVERIAASWQRGHRSVASIATDINEPFQRVRNNFHHAQKRGLLAQDTTSRVPPETAEPEGFAPVAASPEAVLVVDPQPSPAEATAPEDSADAGPPELRCPKEAAIVVAKHGARFYAAGPASPEPFEITRPAYLALRRMAGGQMFGLGTLTGVMGYGADRQDEAKALLRILRGRLAGHGVIMTESSVGWVLRRA